LFCRHSSIFLTEEEKTGEEAGEDDLLPEEIKSFQVKEGEGKMEGK
jgi:hypothetical protein